MSYKQGFLIAMFATLCLGLLIPSTVAWGNGSYAYNATNYDYSTDYGTHDWVADSALIALITADSSKWQWLDQRKTVYLIGTEAPDNSGLSMVLDDTAVYGLGNTAQHHIYFNADGSVKDNASAVQAATYGQMAKEAFNSAKYNLSAYYLGVMSHYIADMGVYAHVGENSPVNLDEHHSDYEGYVKTRTNNYQDRSEFFNPKSFSIGSKSPESAVIDLAWDTYKNPNPSISTIRDAVWMHNAFFSPWVNNYDQRASDTQTNQNYYNRIEESLNNAGKAIADAINYLVGSGSSSIPIDPNTDPSESEDDDSLGIDGYPALWMIGFATLAVTIIIRKRKF